MKQIEILIQVVDEDEEENYIQVRYTSTHQLVLLLYLITNSLIKLTRYVKPDPSSVTRGQISINKTREFIRAGHSSHGDVAAQVSKLISFVFILTNVKQLSVLI